MRIVIYFIAIMFLFSKPLAAQIYDAEACNHNTGDCYDAEIDLSNNDVIIYYDDYSNNRIDLEDNKMDDLTCYDEENNVYYDIEILYY